MLADPKARALTDNFASQWLLLRNLKGHVPTPGDFPNFDNELRQAFRRGNRALLREHRQGEPQRPRPDQRRLHVRQRAAGAPLRHSERLRQQLPPRRRDQSGARRGLLGQGSVLTVTSYPNRTSPVLRGKYILENILGTPPPAPPANVPALSDNEAGQEPQVAARAAGAAPAHAGLRQLPPGDGPARVRAGELRRDRRLAGKEPGGAIDPTGKLADGSDVDGPVALRAAIMRRPDQFVRTFDGKADDLRARPGSGALRYAGRARHHAGRGEARTTGSRPSWPASSAARRSG